MAASGSISKLGRKRWAYRDVFGGFFGDFVFGLDPSRFGRQFKAIVGVFTDGAFAGLNDTFNMNEKLKLVWFGRNDLSGFGLTGPITLPVTLDVPRDRTLRVANGLTVQRDLWLQRGSCLVVDGNLSISGGRLIIEDGATLVVNGNLTCSGTARGGSIVVGGVMKSVHPITCSILCSGDVEIPYGTRSGFAWDDAAMPLIPSTLALLQQLAGGRAANLAKSDGPFHPRLPYVASCETSFVIVLPPLPMMFPSPYQKKNIDASIMRGLSILYAATLNAKVGENFMTYSDWWFSPGMVPEALKADFDVFGTVVMSPALGGELAANPDDALTAAANATSKDARRRFMYAARTAVWERYVLAAATFAVDALNGKLAAAKKYTLPPGSAAIVGLAFPSLVEGIDKLETDVKASQPDTTALTGVLQLCGKAMGWATIWPTLTAQQVRQECGGLLLYARGGIRVGYLAGKPVARTDCALAAGLFVARGDVKMNAETTVGALRSRDGSVSVEGDMWFYPPFTRASLYRTKAEQPGWTERMLSSRYGGDDKRPEDQRCLPVGWGSPLRTSAWGPSR